MFCARPVHLDFVSAYHGQPPLLLASILVRVQNGNGFRFRNCAFVPGMGLARHFWRPGRETGEVTPDAFTVTPSHQRGQTVT